MLKIRYPLFLERVGKPRATLASRLFSMACRKVFTFLYGLEKKIKNCFKPHEEYTKSVFLQQLIKSDWDTADQVSGCTRQN